MSELVSAKAEPLFVKKTHELDKLVRSLKKISTKAVTVLEAGLSSSDEKIRMMAADKLLKFYMDTSKEVSQDALNRLILEIKANGLIGQGSTAQDDDNTPKLDFDNISPEFASQKQEVEDVEVLEEFKFHDMGAVNKI